LSPVRDGIFVGNDIPNVYESRRDGIFVATLVRYICHSYGVLNREYFSCYKYDAPTELFQKTFRSAEVSYHA